MRRGRELAFALALVAAGAGAQTTDATPAPEKSAPAKPGSGFFGLGKSSHSKDPITITSDNLEYEYKDGIVIYRGEVVAIQGDIKVRSDELHITLVKDGDGGKTNGAKAAADLDDTSASKLREVVATGSVRIDQGTRWAVGGKATFDQTSRTIVLTENPVLHDGPNEVAGDRVVVYLDEDRSIVEGGRKRVKAVLFPGKDEAAAKPSAGAPAASAR